MIRYFPDYPDNILPEKYFMYIILATIYPKNTKNLILEWRKKRSITESHDQQKLIEAVPEILEEINSLLIRPSKFLKFYFQLFFLLKVLWIKIYFKHVWKQDKLILFFENNPYHLIAYQISFIYLKLHKI